MTGDTCVGMVFHRHILKFIRENWFTVLHFMRIRVTLVFILHQWAVRSAVSVFCYIIIHLFHFQYNPKFIHWFICPSPACHFVGKENMLMLCFLSALKHTTNYSGLLLNLWMDSSETSHGWCAPSQCRWQFHNCLVQLGLPALGFAKFIFLQGMGGWRYMFFLKPMFSYDSCIK